MVFVNKKILFTVILIIFFLTGMQVFAADNNHGLDTTMKALKNEAINEKIDAGTKPEVSKVIGRIVGGALGLLGSIFFVMLVYGGFMWMTAQGNESQVGKAKDIITWAVWGVAIILLAYVIVDLIFEEALFWGLVQ